MSSKELIAQRLRDAAQYMREHGHTKHISRDRRTGAVCALGAMHGCLRGYETVHGLEGAGVAIQEYYELTDAFANALGLSHLGDKAETIPIWNDADERTADDVITAFEKAAIWVEEQA